MKKDTRPAINPDYDRMNEFEVQEEDCCNPAQWLKEFQKYCDTQYDPSDLDAMPCNAELLNTLLETELFELRVTLLKNRNNPKSWKGIRNGYSREILRLLNTYQD